jgi:hypothetical protein
VAARTVAAELHFSVSEQVRIQTSSPSPTSLPTGKNPFSADYQRGDLDTEWTGVSNVCIIFARPP